MYTDYTVFYKEPKRENITQLLPERWPIDEIPNSHVFQLYCKLKEMQTMTENDVTVTSFKTPSNSNNVTV